MGFGGIGEMMFILLLGLLLFGPKKLPEIARQVGKVLGEFKKASAEFQAQLNDEVRSLDASVQNSDSDNNRIAPPHLQDSAPRNDLPRYALDLEPSSGQHEGEAPSEHDTTTSVNGHVNANSGPSELTPAPENQRHAVSAAEGDQVPSPASSPEAEPGTKISETEIKDKHGL